MLDKSPLTGPSKKVPLSGLHIFPRFLPTTLFCLAPPPLCLKCFAERERKQHTQRTSKEERVRNGGDTISETNSLQRHRFKSQDPTIPHSSPDGSPIRRIRALRSRSPPRFPSKSSPYFTKLSLNLSGL